MELATRLIEDANERHRIKLAKYKNPAPELSNILWEEALREAVASQYCIVSRKMCHFETK